MAPDNKRRRRSSVLIGTAGVYHVASQLAARGVHAAVTYGNAPSVDILVGLLDGKATLSLQVKTSHWALRTKGRGGNKKAHHYGWDVGERSAKLAHRDLFFAFVDLKLGKGETPDVFIVPSDAIFRAFRPYFEPGKALKRWRWHPRIEEVQEYKNNWGILDAALEAKEQSIRSTTVS